jgi:hypothetical protein
LGGDFFRGGGVFSFGFLGVADLTTGSSSSVAIVDGDDTSRIIFFFFATLGFFFPLLLEKKSKMEAVLPFAAELMVDLMLSISLPLLHSFRLLY